jgi:hypothetical protein
MTRPTRSPAPRAPWPFSHLICSVEGRVLGLQRLADLALQNMKKLIAGAGMIAPAVLGEMPLD